jgi:hypothetical protein
MRNDDWLGRLRQLLERGHYFTATELEVAGISRQQVSFAQVLFRTLRRVDRGLYVDARRPLDVRWVVLHARVPRGVVTLETAAVSHGLLDRHEGPLWVALPHGWKAPRTVRSGIAFQHLRAGWCEAELEPFHPPGLPGLELRRFTPVRTFAELLAAGRFGAAEDVGRALLAGGFALEALEAALDARGVRRDTVKRTLQLIRTPRV